MLVIFVQKGTAIAIKPVEEPNPDLTKHVEIGEKMIGQCHIQSKLTPELEKDL
jgi:hypothetical protein